MSSVVACRLRLQKYRNRRLLNNELKIEIMEVMRFVFKIDKIMKKLLLKYLML